MASRKTPVNSIGGAAPKSRTSNSRRTGSPLPDPKVAAQRDFRTNKTGMGSGGRPGATSSWQSQYNTEMSRLKRTKTTRSGMGSGKPSKNGSEGFKKRKPILPVTK